MEAVLSTHSRSPSPPFSNESSQSPASSHSSPESSDFLLTDAAPVSSYKLASTGGPVLLHSVGVPSKHATPHSAGHWQPPLGFSPSPSFAIGKPDEDAEHAIFSEFIQEDAFDPAPLSSAASMHAFTQSPTAAEHPSAAFYPPSLPQALASTAFALARTINPQHPSFPSQHQHEHHTLTVLPSGPTSESSSSASLSAHYRTSDNGPIYPPKASCEDLPIRITNLPERGAKSRVETQIKMDIELVKDDRPVASWRWLRLSRGAATKRRPKKDAKQDTTVEDTLYLSTEVTCASPPHLRVHACSSCIAREAKRVERKKATRVRPMRSDSEDDAGAIIPSIVAQRIRDEEQETDGDGTSRIVLFNCPELLDFSSGGCSLPVRITCYCRHHREKAGFRVTFTLRDSAGRVIGKGISPPIMITDDHKSTQKNGDEDEEGEVHPPKRKRKLTKAAAADDDMAVDDDEDGDGESKSKRKHRPAPRKPASNSVKSPRQGTFSGKSSRRGTPSRRSSPAASIPVPPVVARSTAIQALSTLVPSQEPTSPFDFNAMSVVGSSSGQMDTTAETSPSELQAVLDALSQQMSPSSVHSVNPLDMVTQSPAMDMTSNSPFFPIPMQVSAAPSAAVTAPGSPMLSTRASVNSAMNSMFAGTLLPSSLYPPAPTTMAPPVAAPPADPVALPTPVIDRLIPNSGPMHGGIDVTILGANFDQNSSLEVVFGNLSSPSTIIWSQNTIICRLPPAASPGPVPVWFKGVAIEGGVKSFFTYLDNSDRALMELALQVVGMQMTGRVEDARNVAMRIVGSNSMDMSGSGATSSGPGGMSMMNRDFQAVIIEFLSIIDVPLESATRVAIDEALSKPNETGQTLLHLAAILGFHRLVLWLVEHGADVDARDNNGFTALHFAAAGGRVAAARVLVHDGNADMEIVDGLGRTARQCATVCDQVDVEALLRAAESLQDEFDADASAEEGDEEEEDEDEDVSDTEEGLWMSKKDGVEPDVAESSTSIAPQPARISVRPSRAGSQVTFADDVKSPLHPGSELYSTDGEDQTAEPNVEEVAPVQPLQHPDPLQVGLPPPVAATWLQRTWKHLQPPQEFPNWGLGNFQVAFPMQVPSFATWPAEKVGWPSWYGQSEKAPPPMYTPKPDEVAAPVAYEEVEVEEDEDEANSKAYVRAKLTRRLGFDPGAITDRDVRTYAHHSQKMRRLKQDRMLVLFWLPILLMVIAWGLYEALPALAAAKTTLHRYLPFQAPLPA